MFVTFCLPASVQQQGDLLRGEGVQPSHHVVVVVVVAVAVVAIAVRGQDLSFVIRRVVRHAVFYSTVSRC